MRRAPRLDDLLSRIAYPTYDFVRGPIDQLLIVPKELIPCACLAPSPFRCTPVWDRAAVWSDSLSSSRRTGQMGAHRMHRAARGYLTAVARRPSVLPCRQSSLQMPVSEPRREVILPSLLTGQDLQLDGHTIKVNDTRREFLLSFCDLAEFWNPARPARLDSDTDERRKEILAALRPQVCPRLHLCFLAWHAEGSPGNGVHAWSGRTTLQLHPHDRSRETGPILSRALDFAQDELQPHAHHFADECCEWLRGFWAPLQYSTSERNALRDALRDDYVQAFEHMLLFVSRVPLLLRRE